MRLKGKAKKIYNIIKYSFQQKKYKRINYLLKKSSSNTNSLIIVFSGFSKMGNPPIYNYVDTLKELDAHRLYVLDRFGYNKAGSYYLGEDGEYFVENQILGLVDNLCKRFNITQKIVAGSSKGGSAAIYYGVKMHADYIIAGAPQYHIGDYLNTDKHRPILKGICGTVSESNVEFLNSLLSNVLKNSNSRRSVFCIHYSTKEHTYDSQIKDLLIDLKKYEYHVIEDNNYDYQEHGDVALFFGKYLRSQVQECLK